MFGSSLKAQTELIPRSLASSICPQSEEPCPYNSEEPCPHNSEEPCPHNSEEPCPHYGEEPCPHNGEEPQCFTAPWLGPAGSLSNFKESSKRACLQANSL